jgi:hypothetical protein
MHVQITTRHMALSKADRELVLSRIRFIWARLAHRVRSAVVSFDDLNGPRGGLDVQCRIKLVLRPGDEVNVSATAAFPGAAAGQAAERALRCVRARIRRRWARRRQHPERSAARWSPSKSIEAAPFN